MQAEGPDYFGMCTILFTQTVGYQYKSVRFKTSVQAAGPVYFGIVQIKTRLCFMFD